MSTPSSPSTPKPTRPLLRGARAGCDAASADDLPLGLRCEYPSKFCNNHKAHKEKGGLHKFCDFHREKANQNQKRWQQRRRDARDQLRLKNGARDAAAVGMRDAKAVEDVGAAIACVSSPTDFIEPFPMTDFTNMAATHNAYSTQVYAPAVSFMAGLDPVFQYPFGFPESEPMVDLASTIMFNDPTMANFHNYNWPQTKMESGLENFIITGHGGAIV